MNTNTSTANQDLSPTNDNTLHPEQIIATVIMTRVSEYFGFFVFAIACALVFPKVFFSNYEPIIATLLSFGVFAIAFVARLYARVIFGSLDQKIGTAARITLAMFLLGGSTIFVAFIPSYESIGIVAPILLIVARIGQGIGSGGISEGLPIIMMMNAPENKKSWYTMIPQIGGPLGFSIAAAIFYVLTHYLTPAEFIDWGWRFPFMVVLSLQVVALFTQLRLIDTPEYQNAVTHDFIHNTPVEKVLEEHLLQVIVGAYLPLAAYTLFHIITIFPLGYYTLHPELSISELLAMQAIGGFVAIITCLLSGLMGDLFGRRPFLIVITGMVGILSFFMASLLDQSWMFTLIGFGLLGMSFGQSGGTLPHRFEREYRFTGVALSTDLGWFFGAAFAPAIALSLTFWYGIEWAGYYLFSGVAATLIAIYTSQHMPSYKD